MTFYNEIIFQNFFQNGDVYISSQFIKDIRIKLDNNIKIKYYMYETNINFENFENIGVELYNIDSTVRSIRKKQSFINIEDNTIIVNTWVGVFKKFVSCGDVNLEIYYDQFKDLYDILKIKIEDNIEYYIPSFETCCTLSCNNLNYTINKYSKYNILLEIIQNIYNKINKKKILICNGYAKSHSKHFDQNIIEYLIDNNYFVKVTNESCINNNIIYEKYKKNILDHTNNDLMIKDNTLLFNNVCASQSDIIIGLPSGLFITTFSSNTINKKFIMLTRRQYIIHSKFNVIYSENINDIIRSIEYNSV
jgi:hypothetical protein